MPVIISGTTGVTGNLTGQASELAPGGINNRAFVTNLSATNELLLYNASTQTLQKVTLSNLMTFINNVPYLEFAWVCAPNGAGQPITLNTVTTLSCDTLVANTGNLNVTAPVNNQFTLPAGTYSFEALAPGYNDQFQPLAFVLGLYNITLARYITRQGQTAGTNNYGSGTGGTSHLAVAVIKGQFVTTATNTFDLRLITDTSCTIRNGGSAFNNSTFGNDQRTTIKLWKHA